jgi:hypothetical protein
VLDAPVTILGYEPEDFCVVALMPMLLGLFVDMIPSLLGAAVFAAALYFLKRGKPPGMLLHQLHNLELTRLPGILGPRRASYSPWP